MMMRNVFLKTLLDKRWFIVGWCLGFVAMSTLIVIFYPSLHQDGSLDQLVDKMPAALQGFVGDLSNLKTFGTYLAAQLFDIRIQIIGGVMSIVLALSLSSSEEDSVQLRTTLALPISRTSLLLQKWLAMAVIIGVIVAATGATILLLQSTVNSSIAIDALLRLLGMTWLLLLTLATLTFAVAMATGVRAIATSIGIFAVAGSFILTTFSVGVDWLKSYEQWSLFYYFPAVELAKNTADVSNIYVLATLSFSALAAALLLFRRRDVTS